MNMRDKRRPASAPGEEAGLTLHHVGVVLRGPRQKERLKTMLPLVFLESGEVEEYQAFCEMHTIGDIRIELIFPRSGSPLGRFNHGQGGIHHLAFSVSGNLKRAMSEFRNRAGAVFLDDTPVRGIAGMRVAFLPPINTGGITIELVEEGGKEAEG